jgi:G3E family GTPase
VAETFTFAGEDGRCLGDVAQLDTLVTVVDAFNFLRDYASSDLLESRGESLGEEDERTVVDLLIEQIEFCDVLVVNKLDLVEPAERDRLLAILRSLNPRARLELTSFGAVPLERVLQTGLFDFDKAAQAPGWLQELRGEHTPETEEYGISSFVYQARRPFHPERFFALIEQEWPGVIRSKGYFWLASHPAHAGSWSQAGAVARHGVAGRWWAAVPPEQWPDDEETVVLIKEKWHEGVGDARQELVLIGMDVDEADLRARLDACLLNDSELAAGPRAWMKLHNPFSDWPQAADLH